MLGPKRRRFLHAFACPQHGGQRTSNERHDTVYIKGLEATFRRIASPSSPLKPRPLSISFVPLFTPAPRFIQHNMTATVNSGTAYVIMNVKSGTVIDLSAGDNKTGKLPSLFALQLRLSVEYDSPQSLVGLAIMATIKRCFLFSLNQDDSNFCL